MYSVSFSNLDGQDRRRRYERDWQACLWAAQRFMPHLTLADIERPTHRIFDAHLAGQIAIHMMRYRMNWAQRRIAIESGRGRGNVHLAIIRVSARLGSPTFARSYERAFKGSPTGQERRDHG